MGRRVARALLAAALAVAAGCTSASTPECGAAPAGFEHRTASTDGARLHYVVGGQGPTVVLLHGFPETWWTWRLVMPLLAGRNTVVVPDLRGVGCSSAPPEGYDARTLARDVHQVVAALGPGPVAIVGHDTGGWVAYAYARQYPDEVSRLVVSGAAVPGFGLERHLDFRRPGQGLPHLVLFAQPDVPELLLRGREREYLDGFVGSTAVKESGAFDVYVAAYSRPGRLTAALGQYRAIYRNAEDNRRDGDVPLPMPTLALAAAGETALTAQGLRQVATEVDEIAIPGAGHFVQEERPVELAAALLEFLH